MVQDAWLNALRRIGDGEIASIGTRITVLTAGARIEGAIAREIDFAARFDDDMGAAMRDYARGMSRAEQRGAVEEAAKVFNLRPTHTALETRLERRQELGQQLDELDEDDPRRGELEAERERLSKLSGVLALSEPEVWTFGLTPLSGPLTPPFVRVDVASIVAWWPGSADAEPGDD